MISPTENRPQRICQTPLIAESNIVLSLANVRNEGESLENPLRSLRGCDQHPCRENTEAQRN
jgi:hypothetical protein